MGENRCERPAETVTRAIIARAPMAAAEGPTMSIALSAASSASGYGHAFLGSPGLELLAGYERRSVEERIYFR